jgi:YesN/AraC family two-component response regulator
MATRDHALLIDGEASTREVVRRHLGLVCDVICVTSGHQAHQVLERAPIGVVLTEAQLPDRPGLQLLQEIRRRYPRLPTIMVTGFGSEALCAQAFRTGVYDYFPKPVDAVGLTHTVRWLLRGRDGDPSRHRPERLDDETASGFRRALRHIHEHYGEKLSLADVATVAGLSYFTTSRLLSAGLGVSFQTYLHRLRIDQAKRLLSTTDLSVAGVGTAAGFGDLSRFNKIFLKLAGMTPTAYRRESAGNERQKKGKKRLAGPPVATVRSESEILERTTTENGDGQ